MGNTYAQQQKKISENNKILKLLTKQLSQVGKKIYPTQHDTVDQGH